MSTPSQSGREAPPGVLKEHIPPVLPHEQVFSIRLGNEQFQLSGASICSDAEKLRAPSYFFQYFKCQLVKAERRRLDGDEDAAAGALYLDRDPATFADIARHLQGYHIRVRDGEHYVRLFADAQFYNLPRLKGQLFEEDVHIYIGEREFRVQKDLFSAPGNSPNYFDLGFGTMFSSPRSLFPGLNLEGLLRPPPIKPPSVPQRSADVFADLLHLLRGYPLHIRNEEHRAELLRDCGYYMFKGLEQKLIPHRISFNIARQKHEITVRLEDIRKHGLSVEMDPPFDDSINADAHSSAPRVSGWVTYSRPFVDSDHFELTVEIGQECTILDTMSARADIGFDARKRINRLCEAVANKLNIPYRQSRLSNKTTDEARNHRLSLVNADDGFRVRFEDTSITLNGKTWGPEEAEEFARLMNISNPNLHPSKKRKYLDERSSSQEPWTVNTGQWRLELQNVPHDEHAVECVLVAVKLDAVTDQSAHNDQRSFLGS